MEEPNLTSSRSSGTGYDLLTGVNHLGLRMIRLFKYSGGILARLKFWGVLFTGKCVIFQYVKLCYHLVELI